jgi:drug/metabolite transporter (DMT)-like permease
LQKTAPLMPTPVINLRAPFIALASAVLFGISTPLAKLLVCDVSPWMLAGLLYLGSGFGLLGLYLARRICFGPSGEAGLARSDMPWLAGTIFFGGIVGPLLLLYGLVLTDAASASLLLNLEAVFTLGLAWAVFREHVDARLFFGAVAIVAGAILLSWQGGFGKGGHGIVLIALACLSWGIDNNLTRKISAVDPVVLAALKGVTAGLVNTTLALATGASFPVLATLFSALVFASYGVGLVLFIIALRHLGAARTGAYYGTAPFIGAVAAAIILGSPLTVIVLIAGLLMAFGAWLHLAERHGHEHTHDVLEHDHRHAHDEHHQHTHGSEIAPGEPHSHPHHHASLSHVHAHWPDLHHRHTH